MTKDKKDNNLHENEVNEVTDNIIHEESIKTINPEEASVDYQAKYARALADYQNLLRQTVKEKEDFQRFANENMVLGILPVYDNLKISMKHIDTAAEKSGWADGIGYVVKQFADFFESIGVKEIKTAGHKFDHNKMEAVSEVATDDKKLVHHVCEELTAGYELKGRVIRAARVSVYKINE
ncbi:MAG: nucleotide exchange factor GrpE [bacterium]